MWTVRFDRDRELIGRCAKVVCFVQSGRVNPSGLLSLTSVDPEGSIFCLCIGKDIKRSDCFIVYVLKWEYRAGWRRLVGKKRRTMKKYLG